MITLKAVARDVKVNPKSIRKNGDIPAVYYGFGKAPAVISVNQMEFLKAYEEIGESTIFKLATPEGELDALVQEVALHPVVGTPIHIDFYIVSKERKMQIYVPLEFVGVSPMEKDGGVVAKIVHELHIEALPAQLPQHIVVDLTKLATMGSHISVGDLDLGAGVRSLAAASEVVANVSVPHVEEEVAPVAVDLSAIEVEKKGKKEEEGDAAEAPAKSAK